MSIRNLKRIPQFCREHDAFTEGGVRWQVFNSKSNGLDKFGAVVRVGRRVFIDVDRYFEWVNSQQAHSVA